jgi:hypothetical protein
MDVIQTVILVVAVVQENVIQLVLIAQQIVLLTVQENVLTEIVLVNVQQLVLEIVQQQLLVYKKQED